MFFRKRKEREQAAEDFRRSEIAVVREAIALARTAVVTRPDLNLMDLLKDSNDKLMCQSWREFQALKAAQERERMESQMGLADPPEPLVARAGGKASEPGAGAPEVQVVGEFR